MPHDTIVRQRGSTANVENLSADNPVRIYPSPDNHGIFRIAAIQDMQLDVFSISGKSVLIKEIKAGNNMLDLTGKTSGIYALQFVGTQTNKTIRVIVK